MAAKNLGQKQVCDKCGARYYDFHKQPPVCPRCGAKTVLPAKAAPKASARKTVQPAPPIPEVDRESLADLNIPFEDHAPPPELEDLTPEEDADGDELDAAGEEE